MIDNDASFVALIVYELPYITLLLILWVCLFLFAILDLWLMKGMLTSPVTTLDWSFIRDDNTFITLSKGLVAKDIYPIVDPPSITINLIH